MDDGTTGQDDKQNQDNSSLQVMDQTGIGWMNLQHQVQLLRKDTHTDRSMIDLMRQRFRRQRWRCA